jgi:hypothetical protein
LQIYIYIYIYIFKDPSFLDYLPGFDFPYRFKFRKFRKSSQSGISKRDGYFTWPEISEHVELNSACIFANEFKVSWLIFQFPNLSQEVTSEQLEHRLSYELFCKQRLERVRSKGHGSISTLGLRSSSGEVSQRSRPSSHHQATVLNDPFPGTQGYVPLERMYEITEWQNCAMHIQNIWAHATNKQILEVISGKIYSFTRIEGGYGNTSMLAARVVFCRREDAQMLLSKSHSPGITLNRQHWLVKGDLQRAAPVDILQASRIIRIEGPTPRVDADEIEGIFRQTMEVQLVDRNEWLVPGCRKAVEFSFCSVDGARAAYDFFHQFMMAHGLLDSFGMCFKQDTRETDYVDPRP